MIAYFGKILAHFFQHTVFQNKFFFLVIIFTLTFIFILIGVMEAIDSTKKTRRITTVKSIAFSFSISKGKSDSDEHIQEAEN